MKIMVKFLHRSRTKNVFLHKESSMKKMLVLFGFLVDESSIICIPNRRM